MASPPRLAIGAAIGSVSIFAGVIAVETAGPGALPWMWLGGLLGGLVTWLDTSRGRGPGNDPISRLRRGVGSMPAGLFAVTFIGLALAMGAALQAALVGWVTGPSFGISAAGAGVLLALATAPVLVTRRDDLIPRLLGLAPIVLGLYLIAFVVAGPEADFAAAAATALEQAQSSDAAATGAGMGVVTHGLLRALLAGEIGLGTVSLSEEVSDLSPEGPGPRRTAFIPLAGVALATLTALPFVAAADPAGAPTLDEPSLRADNGAAGFVPLERAHVRVFRPSARGQVAVLPRDTPLEADQRYPVVFRANPRGYKLGLGSESRNAVAVPGYPSAAAVDTVVFRDRDPARSESAAWDLRIPVEQSRIARNEPGGLDIIQLTPTNPAHNLAELSKTMDGPYVVFDDVHLLGSISKGAAPDEAIGDHLALWQEVYEGEPQDLTLKNLVKLGFRGPFLEGPQTERRAPWALVAAEELEAKRGDTVRGRFYADRETRLGYVTKRGELRTPGWNFLTSATHAIALHPSDPAQDVRVPVAHTVADDGTLRWTSTDGTHDFHRMRLSGKWLGIHLEPPPYDVQFEVHSGRNAPDHSKTTLRDRGLATSPWVDRNTLVPVGVSPEPAGAQGLYDPHPAEVAALGFMGPVRMPTTIARVQEGLHHPLLAIAIVLLAWLSAISWARAGAVAAQSVGGPPTARAFGFLFLGALSVGGLLVVPELLATVDVLAVTVLGLNLLGLLTAKRAG